MFICYDKITYEALRMDFQPQIKYIVPTGMPMPFYMTYPDHPTILGPENMEVGFPRLIGAEKEDEDRGAADFEYLRRTYPTMVGRYQKRVEEIMDAMDYDGSMIYDEYPDRISLLDLGNSVARSLARIDENREDMSHTALEEAYLQGLSQVLVCNEIYRRRQKRKANRRKYG